MWLWKVFAGLIFFWIILALLCGVMTLTYFGTNETNIASILLTPQTPSYTNPIGGITATFSVSANYMTAFFNAMFLNFPIFDGPYQIIRILFLTVIIGVLVALVIGAIRTY
jgi:hypothetical protein